MSDTLSWADANAACLAAGLQLATVQSAAQNALLVTAAAGSRVWIGGTDAASEGAWLLSPSNTPLTYSNCQLVPRRAQVEHARELRKGLQHRAVA